MQRMHHRHTLNAWEYLPAGDKSDSLKLPARIATGGGRGRSSRDVVDGASDQAIGRDTLDGVDILKRKLWI